MGDVGKERPVRFEPLPETAPAVEPTVTPQPEQVPA